MHFKRIDVVGLLSAAVHQDEREQAARDEQSEKKQCKQST
jgi:hypothetical protein